MNSAVGDDGASRDFAVNSEARWQFENHSLWDVIDARLALHHRALALLRRATLIESHQEDLARLRITSS